MVAAFHIAIRIPISLIIPKKLFSCPFDHELGPVNNKININEIASSANISRNMFSLICGNNKVPCSLILAFIVVI
jgi:hypothetical protein